MKTECKYIQWNGGGILGSFYTKWLIEHLSKERGYDVTLDELQKEFNDNDYHLGCNGVLWTPENLYCHYMNSLYDIIKKNERGYWELVYQLRPDKNA
jgi:hypothetical protein